MVPADEEKKIRNKRKEKKIKSGKPEKLEKYHLDNLNCFNLVLFYLRDDPFVISLSLLLHFINDHHFSCPLS